MYNIHLHTRECVFTYIRNRGTKLFEARKWSRVSRRVTVTSTSQRSLRPRLRIYMHVHAYMRVRILRSRFTVMYRPVFTDMRISSTFRRQRSTSETCVAMRD